MMRAVFPLSTSGPARTDILSHVDGGLAMNTKDALRATLDNADMIVKSYVEDLTDDDFLAIPVEGMNPIALQLGHLIDTERAFVEAIKPGSCPPLPAGFSEKHNLKGGKPNDRSRYSS